MLNYLARIGSCLSHLANVILLNGHPNESISGRAWRNGWRIVPLINALFFWQNNHCRGAYSADMAWAIEYLDERLPE